MASFSGSRYYLLTVFFLFLCFKTLNADSRSLFGFENFTEGLRFESQFDLFGDAQLVKPNVSLQLSGSVVSSGGRVMYKEPISLLEGNPKRLISFATEFVFSLSRERGDGLAFVLVPKGYPKAAVFPNGGSFGLLPGSKHKFLAVEFDTLFNEEFHDTNNNHVGIDVGSFVSSKVSNVSSVNLVLNSGEKIQAWIDYEASFKRLEVRLSKLAGTRPVEPLVSCSIDLSEICDSENEVFMGLSSSSGKSLQKCNVYSWSLRLRTVPHWIHSEPLDPNTMLKKDDNLKCDQKSDCAMRIIAALIFGIGCGAIGAIVVLFLWTILGNKALLVPADYAAKTKEEVYQKPKAVVTDIQEATTKL